MTAASAGESTTTLIWSATTNWIVAEGSLSDSISFDTSDNVENNQESKPLLLLRPDGGDPPPCEIRIYFRERHEIKMVYVRSTARVYEIYYSSDHQDSNGEYLTTVRCGAAVEEVAPESLDGCRGNNNGNSAITGQVVRSGSNTSDEDGWVQVKPPDSILQDDKEYYVVKKYDSGRDSPKMQIHYEATAEISDCSPCFSITLRLLSIQTKNCVHVEEIYVYADPVESCDPDPPLTMAQNSGASSMFAMLMPSLMQLSKSVTSHERSSSDETRVPKYSCSTAKSEDSEHTVSYENSMAEEVSSEKPPDKRRSPTQEQTEAKAAKFEVTAPPQMPDSFGVQNNNEAYTRIEKVLDDLVLKVGRVEAFCSKFEENMLKPLDCMEKRLQQLEQKLDVLAAKSHSSVQCLCSNVASSEPNEYNSNSEDGNVKRVDQRDIESIEHSAQIEGSSIKFPERGEDTTFIGMTSPADDKAPAILEPQTHPGLVIKAPEFLNEDDVYSNTDVDPLREDIPKNKKSSSIDGALASSLAAFLTSTIVKSPDLNPSVTAISQESVNSDLDSLAPFSSDGAGNLSDKCATEDNGCGFADADGEGSIIAEISSKMDNSSSGKPEAGTECTAFDDSLLVTDADELSPAFAFQSDSGFIGVPLELPSDNTLESHELDCLEDAEVLALENQEEYEIQDEAYLDPALSMPLEASCEQEDCTIFKLYGECTAFDDSLLVANADELSPAFAFQSDSGFIGMPVELPRDNTLDSHELDCLEDPASIARFRETIPPLAEFQSSTTVDSTKSTRFNAPSMSPSIDNNELSLPIFEVPSGEAEVSALENQEEHEIQDEPYLDPAPGMPLEASCERDDCTLFNLYGEVSRNCRGKICVDDDDAGKAILQCFDTEDSNSFSSSQMLDTELSLGGSSGTSAEVSAVADHTKLQAATNNSECDLASEDHSKEVEDVIHNVKFNSDGNWVRGLSLELLLGEILDTKPLEASASSGDGGSIDIELKLSGNSSSTLGLNSVDDEDGSLLL